jgi:DNA-binding protein H-NS
MRTMRTLANHCRVRHTPFNRRMPTARRWFPRGVALSLAPLMLGGCAELVEVRTDIARLRADLHAQTETLSQLSAGLDELERRQAAMDRAARQTQQELSQAIEVLLKKALIAEERLTRTASERHQSKVLEPLESRARQPSSATQAPSPQGKIPRPGGKHLILGMTQDEVRRALGDPISIEDVGSYIFWQYSWLSNEKYVVFEKDSGQVSGWRGL